MDSIHVCGISLSARIGVSEQEREYSQLLHADLQVWLDLRRAGETDEVSDTIDYVRLHEAARDVARARPYHLVEALAEAIAVRLLEAFPVQRVRLRVDKPGALTGIGGARAGVEIDRERHG